MLEIVWRNPRPPRRTAGRLAGAWSREVTTGRMRAVFYRTLTAEDRPEAEFALLVNPNLASTDYGIGINE